MQVAGFKRIVAGRVPGNLHPPEEGGPVKELDNPCFISCAKSSSSGKNDRYVSSPSLTGHPLGKEERLELRLPDSKV